MNTLKHKSEEQIHPREVISLVENLVRGNFLSIIHEPNYPETRKDVCIIKTTLIDVEESFDVVYLIWRNKEGLSHTKLWGTTIYDPPNQRHLMIGYIIEDKRNLIAKIYPSEDPMTGHAAYTGTVYSINKEKLGLQNDVHLCQGGGK